MEKIQENNKLIAEFMGYKLKSCSNGLAWESPFPKAIDDVFNIHGRLFPSRSNSNYLKFHSSWDWLMPVVEKIENIYGLDPIVDIRTSQVSVVVNKHSVISHIWVFSKDGRPKKQAVYEAVIIFINWYNQINHDKAGSN